MRLLAQLSAMAHIPEEAKTACNAFCDQQVFL